jgi:glycosyltransferase involved in cell wall biosynthesis
MPRKLADHVTKVRELVSATEPDVPWVEIDGLPESEVAQRLLGSSIFLSTQDREGCPLPALEAMACGCVVAGYSGTAQFPHPYANAENGFWARDRHIRGAARAVHEAIETLRNGGQRLQRLQEAALSTTRRYDREAVVTALKDLLNHVGRQSYEEREPIIPELGLRSRALALQTLLQLGA